MSDDGEMWLRLPRLLFIQKQIMSRPSCNAPWSDRRFSPELLPIGANLCNAPWPLLSASISSHAVSFPLAFHHVLDDSGWRAVGNKGMWTKKRSNEDSNVLIAVLPEIK